MFMRDFIHVLTIALMLGGGSVYAAESTPDSVAPGHAGYLRETMPEKWDYQTEFTQSLPDSDDWWRTFGDSDLDALITRAMTENFRLPQAAARREMARLAVAQAQSQFYPMLSANAGWSRSMSPGAMAGKGVSSSASSGFNLGVDMSWEIDLFGRISSQVKVQKSAYQASRADYVGAMISMSADIASYYFNLRTYQAELEVAREHLASQAKVVKITEARFEAGLASKLDVAQSKMVYYSTESSVPVLEQQVRMCLNALAIMTGQYSSDLPQSLRDVRPIPDYQRLIPAGVPADLLRRRPDIVAAEYQLAGYASQIGIAKKEFLPKLALNGSIGTAANNAGDLFGEHSLSYSVAPTLTWTIFDGMARKAAVAQAKEQMKAAVAAYNLTVITAVEEVDNAMTSYRTAVRTLEIQDEVYKQSTEAFQLAMDQYKQGLAPFTNVVDAQISRLNSANSLVSARGDALQALVKLYKALGGNPTK